MKIITLLLALLATPSQAMDLRTVGNPPGQRYVVAGSTIPQSSPLSIKSTSSTSGYSIFSVLDSAGTAIMRVIEDGWLELSRIEYLTTFLISGPSGDALTVDSNGDVIIGRSSTNGSAAGLEVSSTSGGEIHISRDDTSVSNGNRIGELVFRSMDSSTDAEGTVGRIEVYSLSDTGSGDPHHPFEMRLGVRQFSGGTSNTTSYIVMNPTSTQITNDLYSYGDFILVANSTSNYHSNFSSTVVSGTNGANTFVSNTGECATSTTAITTNGGDLRVTFTGAADSGTADTAVGVGFLLDGAYVLGQTSTTGITRSVSPSASIAGNLSFTRRVRNLAAATYNVCIFFRAPTTTASGLSPDVAVLELEEIR